MARGYCGPGIPPCDNVTIGDWVSTGTISLDFQGFVYWDGENWGIHPATGVRLSTGLKVSVDAPSAQTTKNDSAATTVRVYGTSTNTVSLSVSGCPAETTCSFNPSDGPARFTSRFVMNTTPASLAGTYSLTITATNGSVTTTTPFQLTIADRSVRIFLRGDGGPFSETDDLYISDGSPNTNFGSDDMLLIDAVGCNRGAGNEPGGVCKSLIKFPSIFGPASGQIAAGSRIVDASLGLTVTNDGKTQTAYQVTEGWDETTATWNSFHTPGVPGNRGAAFTFAPNPVGPLSLNITSIVQRWADGEANQGILFASTSGNGTDYNSSDSVRDRPFLKVQFVPPSSPLLLAYDMETLSESGTMKDVSGNANHGVLTGTKDVSGKVGRARQFNGGSDKIAALVPIGGLNRWTIALWARWDDGLNVFEHPIGLGRVHDATFWFSGTTVAFKAQDSFGNTVVESSLSSTISPGTWYHLAATFNGTTVKGYLDAIETFSVTSPGTMIRSNSIKVGTSGNEADNFFNGTVDEVLIYSRALNASEIAGLAPRQLRSDGPVVAYDMESLTADGRMKDLSGNGRHGTITGTIDVAGKMGRARQFSGGNNKIATVAPMAGVREWTLALWIEWYDGPNNFEHPVGLGAVHDATFWMSGAVIALKATDASGKTIVERSLSSNIATGEWYHLAVTFDGTNVRAYLNGLERFSVVAPTTTIRSDEIKLGTSGTEANNFFGGIIDEVLVFNRALNALEIAALASPSQPSALVLSYDMENLTSQGQVRDLSGNGNHGTLTGTTAVVGVFGGARGFDGTDDRSEERRVGKEGRG